jgi:hypothetical protein
MHWLKGSFAVFAVAAASGCDRLSSREPEEAAPTVQAAPAPAPVPDLQAFSGRGFGDFVTAHEARFSSDALGIAAADAARLQRAMFVSAGALQQGGGAEALVFRGCAASGCSDAVAVVAIDGATGAAFVGVRDRAGKDVLAPNDRLEALLRLNASTRDWADAGPTPEMPSAEAARP